jgi:hypothetical protein
MLHVPCLIEALASENLSHVPPVPPVPPVPSVPPLKPPTSGAERKGRGQNLTGGFQITIVMGAGASRGCLRLLPAGARHFGGCSQINGRWTEAPRISRRKPIPRPIPVPALDSGGRLQPKQVRQVY